MLFTDLSSERVIGAFHLTIPRHKRINPYTLKGIIKDAGLTDEEFKKLI